MATRQLIPGCQPLLRLAGVPVFVYHGLTKGGDSSPPTSEKKYWLMPDQFRSQLREIRGCGQQVARLHELWNSPNGNLPPAIVLTFDDGLASDYEEAFPILLENAAGAEFFVNTATIGHPGFLTWRQIDEMRRAGMSFQSHSHEHVALSTLPECELRRQLKDSKQILEDRLGKPANFLAAPYGVLNRRVVEAALEAGYQAVCSTRSLPARPGAKVVNRVVLYQYTTPRQFRRLLDRRLLGYLSRMAWAPLYRAKSLLSRLPAICFSDAPPQEQA